MGTAVLLPQDCLRPRSRHKHQTSGMIYPLECAPRSKRNPPAPAQNQGAGLLPLPGGHSSPMNIPRRRSDANHFKQSPHPKVVSDVPVYKILQRPKQGDAAVKVLAQFVMLDEVKTRSVTVVAKNASSKGPQNDGVYGADKPNNHVKAEFGTSDITIDGFDLKTRGSDTKVMKVCNEGGSVCEPKDASKYLNGVHTSTAEGYKLPNMKMGGLKPKNVMVDKVHSGSDDTAQPPAPTKPFMPKKVNDISCKAVIVRRSGEHDGMLPKGLTRLRRTSTEPQITTHILGQYRSRMMQISFGNSKPESHADSRGLSDNTTSLSCQERWAGPAYTSSPSPSSLPLPKLCLPNTRFSSLEIPPLVKQYSTSVYMQPFLGSSAPSENGGAWDVAFATKSLRKMLNLDPC